MSARAASSRMRPAASPADFLRSPHGAYFLGRRHLVFAKSPTFMGIAFYGRPGVDDVRETLALCAEVELSPAAKPHHFLADTRNMDEFEPDAFALCVEFTRENRRALAEKIIRKIMLRPPDGMLGAVIAGFANVAQLPHPEEVFDDPEKGVEWLGVDRRTGLEVIAELDAIRTAVAEEPAIVRKLRALLERDGGIGAGDAARRLGISTRTLQRSLEQAGTTYRSALEAVRMKRAKALLADQDRTLAFIASEVGFSSTQHFATAFRRAVGATPSEWRAGIGVATHARHESHRSPEAAARRSEGVVQEDRARQG